MPVPPYAALIFDCDGTLADTLPIHYKAWSETLRLFGVEITPEWYQQRAGVSTVELIQLLNHTLDCQLDVAQVKAEKQRRYREQIASIKPIPSVVEVVRYHQGKLPMAIASGGGRSIVEATLNAIQMLDVFEAVITIEDVARGKPEPDLFLFAAEHLGKSPEDCVVYEDSQAGVEAARRAGMRCVYVSDNSDMKPNSTQILR